MTFRKTNRETVLTIGCFYYHVKRYSTGRVMSRSWGFYNA